MRILFAGTVLMLAAGCEFQPLLFEHESTLNTQTRGLVLHDDGLSAQAGMMGTTCEVDRTTGSVGTDYDYPGSDDKVQDVGYDESGDVIVVVTSDKGAHIQKDTTWWGASSDDYHMTGAQDAVVLSDRVLVFRETEAGCSVDRIASADDGRSSLKPEVCAGPNTITGDPTTGRAFVGSQSGVYVVDRDTVTPFSDEPAELVVWDGEVDALYTASVGDSLVNAYEADGTLRWSVDVGGDILDLEHMGLRGAAAASVVFPDGASAVLVLDGFTGEITSQLRSSVPVSDVATSADGRGIALTKNGRVDFYRVLSLW